MNKVFLTIVACLFVMSNIIAQKPTIYGFTVTTLYGEEFPMSELKGKKVLIVNTASKCGRTPQYADLQKLYEQYGGDKFTIVGFPANNFAKQEPGTNEEIAAFCEVNYGVTFPMMAKISVKGDNIDPLYAWLTQEEKNGVQDSKVDWNFHKFLIDESGYFVRDYKSGVNPMDEEIVNWVKSE